LTGGGVSCCGGCHFLTGALFLGSVLGGLLACCANKFFAFDTPEVPLSSSEGFQLLSEE